MRLTKEEFLKAHPAVATVIEQSEGILELKECTCGWPDCGGWVLAEAAEA